MNSALAAASPTTWALAKRCKCWRCSKNAARLGEALACQFKARQEDVPGRVIGPTLIVVPKSLVFNWVEEAKRFTPKLKVLNFTGLDRRTLIPTIPEHDVVITTYSTMRLEIEKLREHEFDYVILDEVQAIKNSQSQAAKASLLLKGRRRLAMSGTPIENHLGELASLLEFLNPGLLGSVSQTKRSLCQRAAGDSALG